MLRSMSLFCNTFMDIAAVDVAKKSELKIDKVSQ